MNGYIVVVEQEHTEDDYSIEAVVTKGMNGMSAEQRAYDIAYRIQIDDSRSGEVRVIPVELDPSNAKLKVLAELAEVPKEDFVKSAYLDLRRNGDLQVPLWVNMLWLVNEVRARYEVDIESVGRKMTLVHDADKMRPSATVVTEAEEDAGFAETEDFD